MSTASEILRLMQRVKELENALLPFALAAEGFEDGTIYLEYAETDGRYYQIYTDDEALSSLSVQNLLDARKVFPEMARTDDQ
jgi:hypothetical protein